MSEEYTPYQTVIQVENARRFGWMKADKIKDTQRTLYLLSKTLDLIEKNEEKYRICIEQSRSNLSAIAFPEIRNEYLYLAKRARIRAERLVKEFNILAMELGV